MQTHRGALADADKQQSIDTDWVSRPGMGLLLAGVIGVLAACAVGAADVASLYVPGGGAGSGSYQYLRDIPLWRLRLGHFLGVLALPLEAMGLWQASRLLLPAGNKAAFSFLVISVYSVIVGAVYHAALAPIAAAVQAASETKGEAAANLLQLVDTMAGFARPFATLTGFGVVLISAIFSWAVGFRQTRYPRWMALASPLTLAVIVIALGRTLPVVGDVLLPATFSIANAIFFALSTACVALQLGRPAR